MEWPFGIESSKFIKMLKFPITFSEIKRKAQMHTDVRSSVWRTVQSFYDYHPNYY